MYYWIGLLFGGVEPVNNKTNWVWEVNRQKAVPDYWYPDSPNGDPYYWATAYAYDPHQWTWNDDVASAGHSYICEIGNVNVILSKCVS